MTRVLLATTLCALATGCGGADGDEAAVVPKVSVGVETVASDTMTEVVSVVGRLTPAPGGSVLLTAPAPGVVARIHVQVGGAVGVGQLLLELEVPDLVQNARALAAAAEAADRDAKRQQELLVQGITSARAAEQRQAESIAARAQAEAAAQLLSRAQVRSPIAGGVQRVVVHAGERVDAGAPLAEVIDGRVLDLVASVPAADLARLRVDQPAAVVMDGSSEAHPGRLVAITPAVDSLTNAAQVVIRIGNAGRTLRAGSGATGLITIGRKRSAIVVPDSALVVLGESLAVFVVEGDSIARARTVTVGVRLGGRAEVSAGLRAGERVVVSGAFGLADGMLVTPTGQAKP
jgi:membrane fusion protein (multidrug efflux system)